MKQADFAPYIEREYKDFDLRITKVDYDRKRLRVVRDCQASIASVPRGASYVPNLLSDGYAYIKGAHMHRALIQLEHAGAKLRQETRLASSWSAVA
jgi:hypothetical protein